MDFLIPSSREDLLNRSESNQYCIEDLLTVRQVPVALQGFKSVCRGNPCCILEHFDTLFSILCLHRELDRAVREEAWTSLLKGCATFTRHLESTLEDSDLCRENRVDTLNALKMLCYLLCQFMEQFDGETAQPCTVVTGKGRGKKSKQPVGSTTLDWEAERQEGVQTLLYLIQLPVTQLWDPPVAEVEFVSLVSTCCYKLLENSSVAKAKDTVGTIGHILGHLVKRFNHGLGASLKIDQLLKHFEFLTSPIVNIVEIIVKDQGCKSLIVDIMREIGNADPKDAARDSAAAKGYATFLAEIAGKMPEMLLPCLPLVVGHLEGESYTLRNGVLSIMGEILVKYLCKAELDEKLRITRDGLFDKLEDHAHDVHAFARSKVLQIWLNIVTEKCLPLLRQESLMTLVVGRLNDKSSIVRRHALQLVIALLKSNPFAAQLSVDDLRTNYEKEKATLEEMTPEVVAPLLSQSDDGKLTEEWNSLEKRLAEFLASESFNQTKDKSVTSLIEEDDEIEGLLVKIVQYLDNGDIQEAVCLTLAAADGFPDHSVFHTLQRKESSEENIDDKAEERTEEEDQDVVKVTCTLKEIFFRVKGLPVLSEAPDSSISSSAGDTTELVKQQTLVQYLKNSLTFALKVQQCIPVICQLLGSKNVSDVLEAIQFFVTALEFGVSSAIVGVRKMMVLVWSQEASVRDAVVSAYKTLYLEPADKNKRSVALSIVKNLTSLVADSTYGGLMSLEALVSEFVKSGHIDSQVIKALWEWFTMKSDAVTPQEARAAVNLIAMCAQAEPEIVKSNIEVLIQEGLGPRAEADYLLAQGTCQALLKLTATKEKGKPLPEPFRLNSDHDLATQLKNILVKGVRDLSNTYWIPLMDLAVTVIYKLLESPDVACTSLLRELVANLQEACSETEAQSDQAPDTPAKSSVVTCVLTRLLSLAGQVAFRQAVFMEVDVLTEMKRRQVVAEESKSKGRRKSKGGVASGTKNLSRKSETELEEDMALAGASADDLEMDYIRRLCETELFSPDNFLTEFQPLLIAVCSNSARFSDSDLQTAATLALARFMIVSSQFCESQLQLLFTILERSSSPVIRSNLVIALGDLTFRFPNLIEPWTSHLYARLRDESVLVRRTTLQVLTHLILNDMVKVKGQISELAVCIVDPDAKISGLSKLFFLELAKKGNSMYNMPDIISRLSDPDIGVTEDEFQTIIKYIFSHIEKSKHCESLAEKLCHRFRATRTERQARDLSYCLMQLSYTEKGLAKLLENFSCFADKLVDVAVYEHFCQIVSKCKHFIRAETKVTVEEFEKKLQQAHNKGLEEEEVATKASHVSVVTGPKSRGGKSKAGSKKKPANKKKAKGEDDDEEENISPVKPRKQESRHTKNTNSRYVFDSDDENDDVFFNFGTEGKKDRDLDEEDSFVIKPSQRRSKRGKVALTPIQSPAV